MSENTNTPNGASKDLYANNPDKENIEVNFLALEERDPQRGENDSDAAGSNTSVVPVEIGTIETDRAAKVGYVGIPVINVPYKGEYGKRKDAIKKRAELSQEDHDRNNDGIDDRNQ